MQATQRIPLSLDPCLGNNVSNNNSSSSGSATYRYPEANRCGELAFNANRTFEEMSQADQLLTKWEEISAFTLFAGLVSIKLPSRLKFIVRIISTIFFLVKCLPGLIQGLQAKKDVEARKNLIYTNVSSLIDEIIENFSHQTLALYLPAGTFQGEYDNNAPYNYVSSNLEITQELQNGLDRFINEKMRILHGWNQLKSIWSHNPFEINFENTPDGHQRYLVDYAFRSTDPFDLVLDRAVKSLNRARTAIENNETREACCHTFREILTCMESLQIVKAGWKRGLGFQTST